MFERTTCGFLALALLSLPQAALAASEAQVNAIIKSLAPISGQTVTPGYGGSRTGQPVELVIDNRTIIIDYRHAIDLEVYFPFDSAAITPTARSQLDALGQALSSPELAAYRYLIAGHTDAKGSDAYNLDLSVRRAHAARDYLVEFFPIDPARLVIVGWGESRLKDPHHPRAAINRRVEVALMALPEPVSSAPMAPYVEQQPTGTTQIIVPNQPSSLTITIEQQDADRNSGEEKPADAADADKQGEQNTAEAVQLPPCPPPATGNSRDPNADLDDFKARPDSDCQLQQGEAIRVGPNGKIIIQW